jgi:hypothetical protein
MGINGLIMNSPMVIVFHIVIQSIPLNRNFEKQPHAQRQNSSRYRLHQRHWPGHCQSLAAQGANIVLNGFGDVEGPQAEVSRTGCAGGLPRRRHEQTAEIEDMMPTHKPGLAACRHSGQQRRHPARGPH